MAEFGSTQVQSKKEKTDQLVISKKVKTIFVAAVSVFIITAMLVSSVASGFLTIDAAVQSFSAIFGVIVAFISLLYYLRREESLEGEGNIRNIVVEKQNIINEIDKKIAVMQSYIHDLEAKGVDIDSEIRQELISEVKDGIKNEAHQNLLDEIYEKVKSSYEQKFKTSYIEEMLSNTILRLNDEINSLTKRGNINLVLGLFTAIAGIVVLGVAVFSNTIKHAVIYGKFHTKIKFNIFY